LRRWSHEQADKQQVLARGPRAVRLVLDHEHDHPSRWATIVSQLLARRPFKVVAVALANKMVRMAWALLAHGGSYRAPELA
jgi:hypothetical protein